MNLITIENISKSYSEKPLFTNLSLGINDGDKIGVIGVNGAGKSTLLKIIAGTETPDDGRIIKGSSVTIEYLSQEPYFEPEDTVLTLVFRGHSPVMKVIREYETALQETNVSSEKLMELTHRMDSLNAWNIESEAKTVLTKLGIYNFNVKVGTLSGGQRKRIALASSLINASDLLILDEPTNHLDNDTIDWLEQYLNRRRGSLLMITHDRYFLDRVVNEIIELDGGNLYTYKGNYSSFLEKKVEREEMEATNEKKRQSLFKKELAWIKRGAKARTTKQKARIDRFEKISEQAVDTNNEEFEISVASSRLGRKVIELENINKAFGDNNLINDFSYTLLKDDRIGIVGPNGIGKSTLLNIVAGKIETDSGKVEIGETVRIGVFSQESYHMNEDLRVIEYIREGAEFISNDEGYKLSASQMLERFLFTSEKQWTPISKLSGGEKRRLYLLRILMEAPNVLLLDEPTNDIDIETLSILEDYIEEFPGAVIAVSHDRYFLDRMTEKLFVFKGNGKIEYHTGNYTEFKDSKKESEEINKSVDKSNQAINKSKETVDKNNEKRKDKPLKFTFKEQKEYEEIDSVIAELEVNLELLEKKVGETASDYSKLQDLLREKEEVEVKLEEKMERWIYLNDLAEKIESEKNKR
jgi:ABC transport system ATP-binding/permease protein